MYLRIFSLSILCAVMLHATVASAAEPPRSAHIVTSSDLQLTKADHAVCLDQQTWVRLPADAQPDQVFVVEPCSEIRSFFVFALAPEGHEISGSQIFTLDGGALRIQYLGSKLWRVQQ
jgi:hypothetical protein